MWYLVLLGLYIIENQATIAPNQEQVLLGIQERLNQLETIFNEQSQKLNNINMKLNNFEKNDQRKCNIDEMYKNLVHTISFMDNKFNNYFMQIQNTMKNRDQFLEQFDETIKTRYFMLSEHFNDLGAQIEESRTKQNHIIDQLVINLEKNYNITNEIIKNGEDKLYKLIETNLEQTNNTEKLIKSIDSQLKNDLNDYANKVGDMSTTAYENSATLKEKLMEFKEEVNFNLTKIYDLLLNKQESDLIEKISEGRVENEEITEFNMDIKLSKIISNQELFMENCHRLQIDETQIEQEISEIMRRLIGMLDQKYSIGTKEISNLEKTFENFENQLSRSVHSTNLNIASIFEKITKYHEKMETSLGRITRKLNDIIEKSTVEGQCVEKLDEFKKDITDSQSLLLNEVRFLFLNTTDTVKSQITDLEDTFQLNTEENSVENDSF